MNVLEIMGILFLTIVSILILAVVGFSLSLFYTSLKKKHEYLSLLSLENKLKKERTKYMNLLNKLEALPDNKKFKILTSILPKEKQAEIDKNEFITEWNKIPLEEKLKMVVYPSIEKLLESIPFPEQEIDTKENSNTKEPSLNTFLDELNKLTPEELMNVIKDKYPSETQNEKHFIDLFTPESFTTVWGRFTDNEKIAILEKKLSSSNVMLLFMSAKQNLEELA